MAQCYLYQGAGGDTDYSLLNVPISDCVGADHFIYELATQYNIYVGSDGDTYNIALCGDMSGGTFTSIPFSPAACESNGLGVLDTPENYQTVLALYESQNTNTISGQTVSLSQSDIDFFTTLIVYAVGTILFCNGYSRGMDYFE